MKKVFMASAIAAMMMAAVSCGCNNSEQAEALQQELQELVDAIDSAANTCCGDSTCTECAEVVTEPVEEVTE